jgi:hypothetical protein
LNIIALIGLWSRRLVIVELQMRMGYLAKWFSAQEKKMLRRFLTLLKKVFAKGLFE